LDLRGLYYLLNRLSWLRGILGLLLDPLLIELPHTVSDVLLYNLVSRIIFLNQLKVL
jgi:hypothetical protein